MMKPDLSAGIKNEIGKNAAIYVEEDKEYVYTLVKEDFYTGEQAKRRKKYYSFKPDLQVGGLYIHLGKGYPGCYRVLSVEEELVPVFYNMENERKTDATCKGI